MGLVSLRGNGCCQHVVQSAYLSKNGKVVLGGCWLKFYLCSSNKRRKKHISPQLKQLLAALLEALQALEKSINRALRSLKR